MDYKIDSLKQNLRKLTEFDEWVANNMDNYVYDNPHFCASIQIYYWLRVTLVVLKEHFVDCINCFVDQNWLRRSWNLTPLDFFQRNQQK